MYDAIDYKTFWFLSFFLKITAVIQNMNFIQVV